METNCEEILKSVDILEKNGYKVNIDKKSKEKMFGQIAEQYEQQIEQYKLQMKMAEMIRKIEYEQQLHNRFN